VEKVVKVVEVVEIDKGLENEKGEDESDDEEDDEVTDEDRREKAKIALVMVDLWDPREDDVVEAALVKLLALAQKERNRKWIRVAGAIPILIAFLKKTDASTQFSEIQRLSLAILATLSRNVVNRDEIRKHEGLPILLRLSHHNDPEILLNTLKCCKECSKNAENTVILRNGRHLKTIVPMCTPENEPVQIVVLDTIHIMCVGANSLSQAAVREAGGVPVLINLLVHPNPAIRGRAVRTLGSVSCNNRKIQQMVRRAKAIPTAVKLITDSNEEVARHAAGGIGAIAENDNDNQLLVRKCGGVEPLVKLLSSTSEATQEHAAAGIRSLAKNCRRIQADFRTNNGIPLLVKLLNSESDQVKVHATGALMEIARDQPKNAEAICNAGAIGGLVSALQSESSVLQYLACGAVWALSRKSSRRKAAFRDANAVMYLKNLANSDTDQVRKGAAWALEVLGNK